jgi:hypothetical protein
MTGLMRVLRLFVEFEGEQPSANGATVQFTRMGLMFIVRIYNSPKISSFQWSPVGL